ncbi:MAG: FAD linked oxidase domain-containing protein [Rhodospirillaceae bacterium]|nr:MAG: FAD linked oxidase domain-containing protein [Rhodospirillaceae bacterium]
MSAIYGGSHGGWQSPPRSRLAGGCYWRGLWPADEVPSAFTIRFSGTGRMRPVSSWGRLSAEPHLVAELSDIATLVSELSGKGPAIPLGMGRSYGDACLNPGGTLLSTARLDRFHSFDPETGRLVCEAGVQLRDIQRFLLPRGWSLPLIPGTQIVSVGGAIANDVHGKNHHRVGSFGHHVRTLTLVRTDGQVVDCGPGVRPDLFAATVGGIGLTGLIATAELQLQPVAGPWLDTEILSYRSLEEFLTLADDSESLWEHTVSWIDCTVGSRSRGIFLRANPAVDQSGKPPLPRRLAVPVTPPLSPFNRLTLPVFNSIYYHLNRHRSRARRRPFDTFLFPLDDIQDWNRLYGPRGFFQYQLVVPRDVGPAALRDILDIIARSGQGSFLAVIKTFGERASAGLLSFPTPGITLSLDFPNRGQNTERLFVELDAVVRSAGGRLYLAKDARMPREVFEAGYPRAPELAKFRDPGMSSGMSRRLMGQ